MCTPRPRCSAASTGMLVLLALLCCLGVRTVTADTGGAPACDKTQLECLMSVPDALAAQGVEACSDCPMEPKSVKVGFAASEDANTRCGQAQEYDTKQLPGVLNLLATGALLSNCLPASLLLLPVLVVSQTVLSMNRGTCASGAPDVLRTCSLWRSHIVWRVYN